MASNSRSRRSASTADNSQIMSSNQSVASFMNNSDNLVPTSTSSSMNNNDNIPPPSPIDNFVSQEPASSFSDVSTEDSASSVPSPFLVASAAFASHGILSSADVQRLFDHQITVDLFPELLDADMTSMGLSLPTIIKIRRTRVPSPMIPSSSSSLSPPASAVPLPSSSSTPAPLSAIPKPSIPTFRGSGSHSFRDPDEFLSRFEAAMLCSRYPQSSWSLNLLNQLSQFVDFQFWQENALTLDWDHAKALFIQHFRHPNALQMRIDELTQIRQKPAESIREYLDRFASLVRLSHQPDDSPLLVSYFRRGLANAEVKRAIDLREDIRNPFANYRDISDAALFCEAQLQRRTMDEKSHKSPAPHASPPGRFKCDHHGENATHPTKDCIVLNRKKTDATKSSSPTQAPSSSMKPAASAPYKQPVVCYKCNKEGHLANRCPQSSVPSSSSSHSTAPKSTGKSVSFAGLDGVEVDDDDPDLTAFIESFAKLNKDQATPYPSELFIPVTIAETTIKALIDTGATRSYLKQSIADDLNLPRYPTSSKVRLGDRSLIPMTSKTEDIFLKANDRTVSCQLGILPDLLHDMIMGRDIMFQFGISISGLPDPSHACSSTDNDDNMIDQSKDISSLTRISADDLQQIMDGTKTTLNANAAIPSSSFCNLPESVVCLHTFDHRPIFRRQYPIPRALQPAVTDQVMKWLASHRIREATPSTQWNLPLTVAPKKDLLGNKTAVRVCVDTRAINAILPDDNYPIPRISDLFEKLRGFKVASSLDLRESYTQLLVRVEDQHKLTFTWNSVRYSWQGSPYGLKFLTAHFQRVMTSILSKCLPFVIIFVDDIVVFSDSVTEHIVHLNAVISTLNSACLRLNLDKCQFGFTQLPILGHIISGDSIKADPDKIASFHNLPIPRTGKQVESFLGMANYLREYVPLYARICAPLEKLRKVKTIGEEWTPACQRSFELIKKVLSEAPTLTQADPALPLLVATDASQHGVGAVLYQTENGKNRFIAFASKALNPAQVNYPATRRELLAVIFAVSKFRNWLYGQKFTLFCDHAAITYLFTGSHETKMLNYWAYTLLEYNFTIVHRPGILNTLPDALSRLYPSLSEEGKAANQVDQLNAIDLDIRSKRVNQDLQKFVRERLNKKADISDDEKASLLSRLHALNHLGADALFKQVWSEGYYWPTLLKDCRDHTSQCVPCQQFNISRQGFHPLNPIHASLPFDHLAIDLAGPFPTSVNGMNFLFVITDIATRFTLLRAIPDKTALTIAACLYQIFADFGFPKIIQSDNGTEFVNSVVDELRTSFGFDHRTISPYHPQANGAAESHVKISKQILSKLCNGQWNNWDLFIPATQHGMNLRVTKRHGSTPFSLMFARAHNPFKAYDAVSSEPLTEEQLQARIKTMTELVFPLILEKTSQSSKKSIVMFQKSHKILDQGFPDGSYVMLNTESRTSKLHPKYEGPFKVLKRTKGGSYTLLDSTGALYPRNVSPDKLKVVSLPPSSSSSYEVEKILKHRGPVGNREYLVKWKGYSAKSNTWEPAANFESPLIIQQYHDRVNAGGK